MTVKGGQFGEEEQVGEKKEEEECNKGEYYRNT
jgi:hypothetical protein